jgi:hypothetical protein
MKLSNRQNGSVMLHGTNVTGEICRALRHIRRYTNGVGNGPMPGVA